MSISIKISTFLYKYKNEYNNNLQMNNYNRSKYKFITKSFLIILRF